MIISMSAERHMPVEGAGRGLRVGQLELPLEATLELGPHGGQVAARDVAALAERFARVSGGACRPQLAALAYGVTGDPAALAGYYPLVATLDEQGRRAFYELARGVAASPRLDVQLLGHADAPRLEGQVRMLVAGHLAEIFFQRPDILTRLLASPRPFRVYTSQQAYARAGGIAGGCYRPETGAVYLVLQRLYEGFYGEQPGVAPLLHELGHMLDHFDVASGRPGRCEGLLPGMSPADGACFTPRAREFFLRGKRLELERYRRRYDGVARTDEPLPIGHPYVFQNDGEFLAGYLELFFRNPHYFAEQNPELFQGFAELFRQDPRPAWPQDFDFYVRENRAFYHSGERPARPGLTVSPG